MVMSNPGLISSAMRGVALFIFKCRFGTGITEEENHFFFKLVMVYGFFFFFEGAEDVGMMDRMKEWAYG